jgi:hypothetical protein
MTKHSRSSTMSAGRVPDPARRGGSRLRFDLELDSRIRQPRKHARRLQSGVTATRNTGEDETLHPPPIDTSSSSESPSQEVTFVRSIKILERILGTIPIMFGVAIIVFFFIRLTPGDPVDIMMGQGGAISPGELEQLREEFHLNEPLHIQLWYFCAMPSGGSGILLCAQTTR